ARLAAASGDLDGARRDLDALARRRGRWNTFPTLVPALLVAPELVPAASMPAARERAGRMLREARGWGTPRAIGMALHTAGLAEDGPRSIDLLQEAAEMLSGTPARVEHARAAADLGAALLRAGR